MPTRDRRALLPLAIKSFMNQTYAERELIILDDGDQPLLDLIPVHPRVHFHSGPASPQTIGMKRNVLVKLAHGPVCVNFDDDDWSSPDRIEHQLKTLLTSGKALTGFSTFYFWDSTTSLAFVWDTPTPYPPAPGASQMFLRDWALRNPFRPINIPEDFFFEQTALKQNQLTSEPGLPYLVARYHGANTWKANMTTRKYTMVPRAALPPQFLTDAGIL